MTPLVSVQASYSEMLLTRTTTFRIACKNKQILNLLIDAFEQIKKPYFTAGKTRRGLAVTVIDFKGLVKEYSDWFKFQNFLTKTIQQIASQNSFIQR
jgi:hypothetical protein